MNGLSPGMVPSGFKRNTPPVCALVVEDSTKFNLDEGLTIRVDQKGFSYLRDGQGVHILKDYP